MLVKRILWGWIACGLLMVFLEVWLPPRPLIRFRRERWRSEAVYHRLYRTGCEIRFLELRSACGTHRCVRQRRNSMG